MTRWAFLTVFLYAVLISALVTPILLLLGKNDLDAYFGGFFVFILPLLLLIQATLLLVPVAVVRERPVRRRSALTSAIVGAVPMGVLLTCFLWFILLMILGEADAMEEVVGWVFLGIFGILWLFWGVLFFRSFSADNPRAFTTTVTGWLLKGSILEVLVAIPSHIISRN